jgi:F0F1-type ATP synthase delta subunit
MISSAVVNRYANALADVVLSPQSEVKPAEVIGQLRAFSETVQASSDLRSVLASPAIPVARKRAVIKDIAQRLGLARIVRNFVLVLVRSGGDQIGIRPGFGPTGRAFRTVE